MKKINLLFFCFGYAIHAERRIKIFTQDPTYEVTVVSDYDYKFENAKNVLLKRPFYNANTNKTKSTNNVKNSKPTDWRKMLLDFVKKSRIIFSLLFLIYDLIVGFFHIIKIYYIYFKTKPDIIFLQTLMYPTYLSFFLPKKIPIIITFWNGDITWWAKWNGLERFFKKKIVEFGVKRAKIITVNSQTAFQKALQYNISEKKIRLLQYPALDLSNFYKRNKEESKKLLNIENKQVILCPRSFSLADDYLNNLTILKAAQIVLSKNSDILFLFVGNGNDEDWNLFSQNKTQFKFLKQNYRNDKRIVWNQMPIYYAVVDIILSITSSDSLPNCLLEAMACKVPIILGDIPQIREIVTDNQNGFLVETNDYKKLAEKIDIILEQKTDLNTMLENNLTFVKNNFDSVKNCKQIKEIVNNLIN